MDYHLYHRFRLFWLGYEPQFLAKIEIGSHLRHQKEGTEFDAYLSEIADALAAMFRVLKYGRYAALIVGDALYKNKIYQGAESIGETAAKFGFEQVCIIERQLHQTKRSFVSAGRRATSEKLLLLRKPPKPLTLHLQAPPYKLWSYEATLQRREIENVLGTKTDSDSSQDLLVQVDPYLASAARKLVFTHSIYMSGSCPELTWQAIIENGFAL
jgi:hypothetical protein